jgi:hypothetical protein
VGFFDKILFYANISSGSSSFFVFFSALSVSTVFVSASRPKISSPV